MEFTRISSNKGPLVTGMVYCVGATISIPSYAIVASSSKFLSRYDVGSLDHTDLSIMSSPHIWNLLELPRIKVLLLLVWSIVWMPSSVYPTTAIVASSSRFLPRYDDGSLDHADLSIMSSPHIWNLLELPRIKVLLLLVWSIVWMPPSVYPTTAIVASSSRFLPRYGDGSLDQADLSIMSSPHICNLLEIPQIKILLSLVWSIVWMPPSVYPVMQSWHPLISFFLGMMLGAGTRPVNLSCSVHILSLVCSIVWMPPSVYPVMQSWHPLVSFFLSMMLGAWTMPICLSFPVHIYGIYSNFPE